MLVVIAVIGVLASIQLASWGDSRQKAELESSQAVVFHALESAREKAVFGVSGTKHGVRINSDEVIVFEGDTFTGSGTVFPISPQTSTDHSGTDIIFNRISGDASSGETITITHDNGDLEVIKMHENGFIE